MKRIILIAVAVMLLCSVASDESMFAELTYDQLFIIRSAIEQEIISRPEWKEVTVPTGDWIVVIDIPAGYYSIRPVKYGYIKIKDTNGSLYFSDAMDEGETIGKIELLDGYSIRIEDPFVFSAPKGLDF